MVSSVMIAFQEWIQNYTSRFLVKTIFTHKKLDSTFLFASFFSVIVKSFVTVKFVICFAGKFLQVHTSKNLSK